MFNLFCVAEREGPQDGLIMFGLKYLYSGIPLFCDYFFLMTSWLKLMKSSILLLNALAAYVVF